MSMMDVQQEYWASERVREYLGNMGFLLPLEPMEGYIRSWHEWMSASGSFYQYKDTDGFGRVYEVHRRSIHPAMRMCQERGSLLLNDKTEVVTENQTCTDWLGSFFSSTDFMPAAQATVVKAFGMGTGAWALWVDAGAKKVRVRHYDARMVVPLSWDEEGVTEAAFVTRVFYRGKSVDQLQMHLLGPLGTYVIRTVCFDSDGNVIEPDGVLAEYNTGCPYPTFTIVRPAVTNTRVDFSPYGQSVFADAIDAIQAVDLAFDALITEVDVSKMRKRLAYAAKTIGEAGVVAAVSPEEMWSLGLEMDCGKAFERMYRQELGDIRSLELDSDRIDDPLILGSAIFSEWQYYTHWANCGMDEDAVRWFEVAARRLGEITDLGDMTG